MNQTIRTALLAGLAAAYVACNSSGGGGSGLANARDFCQEAIQVELAKLDHCGGLEFPPFYVSTLIDCRSFQDAQDAGRVAYDEAQASACLDALEAMSCLDYMRVDLGSFEGLPEECRAAMAPRVATGDPCYSALGYECTGYCDFDSEEACFGGGTCRDYVADGGDCSAGQRCTNGYRCNGSTCEAAPVQVVLGEGGDCTAPNTVCDDPYYCCFDSEVCTFGTCKARKVAGDLCNGPQCELGLRCISGDGPATCVAPLAAGAECVGGDCAQGLFCNDAQVCAQGPRLGESCAEPESEDQVWCVDSWCDHSAAEPTCQPFVEVGAPCAIDFEGEFFEEQFFLSCGPGYFCVPSGFGYGICGRLYCAPVG
jgi:hypothetical protein